MTDLTGSSDWYKDIIIYEISLKSFYDSNGDGIGDFPGLISRLDYLEKLGITALWIIPFTDSPLRDDGYDIRDYYSVYPPYGTIGDFQKLLEEAHKRGIRIITELVLNHTSNTHPWFISASSSRSSPFRDYYVWSDSPDQYKGTRIIFSDTEKSNWSWEPRTRQYYWHRFFHHQPDLNFENPRVQEELFNVVKFWFSLGVDGLRCDAVPYLFEREGTNCENLPETHAFMKRLRKEIDLEFPGRMLLAEANQWPQDVLPYFGQGDEFHMAYHFPLMPRLFIAVAQGDRTPILDILDRTPEIPESCQWAIFLRNHDELTLEMVTDQERDYLWSTYAQDPRMRLNIGIRRRLSPLMQNDRRKIDLMYSLLLTLPGTPILYYGDEIGMGDNVHLGDRNGVRTPMQWSSDRNGGFSRANPSELYSPVIQNPIYGYQVVNVENQLSYPTSPLNVLRQMIQVRQSARLFGRSKLTVLNPKNNRIFAYLREIGVDVVLVLNNLSDRTESVTIDLSRFIGYTPVELFNQTRFPQIRRRRFHFTISPYGFFWLQLIPSGEMTPDKAFGGSTDGGSHHPFRRLDDRDHTI
ncbi:MAG: maltose alpha-D-glucosyltransferase [Nitrospirota bacterium]|nr:maltose alpha-D-glucosyltransferase [Nitrospirota bacterium]